MICFVYSKDEILDFHLENFVIQYKNNSILIPQELENKYNISSIYCTNFKINNINIIDNNKFKYVVHTKLIIV